jgi:acyl-CoA reductase-like NAD-dependent aldehyde dehydrogenase
MQDATKHYINGQWVISIDGREMPVENPSTEKKIATITMGGVADADAAVAAAKAAFPTWAATDPLNRIAALERLMEVYKTRAEDMAQAISREMGAPIALAKTAQVGSGVGHLKNTIRTAKAFVFERPFGRSCTRRYDYTRPRRCLCPDHPMELADEPGDAEGRPGAGRGLHGGAETLGTVPAQRHPVG